jgi:EAL domain-containing protein (putative c-di-GMP-specific phosphodiesterase class I)
VLAAIAGRLVELGGDKATAFRLGGDGFALLFPRAETHALAIGEKIVKVLGAPHSWNERSVFAPASAGLALGRDARDPLELIRNAQLALRRAKRDGGACARLYGRDLDTTTPADEVALDADLRKSFAQGEIELVYQPIMRLADGSISGFEALLRWNHPERGQIAPAEFISHTERTGFIVELGRFALSRAAADLGRWQKMFPLEPPLFVSANVSGRQLKDPEFEKMVKRLMATSGVTPGTLKLEMTESAASAGDETLEILRRLRGCGASLALDDFGTGVSTLSQLGNAPFDTVKIDQSFLARHGEGDKVVLRTVVSLSRELGRSVVIEGVETEQDALWLKEIGCDYAQGFFFAAALARNDVPVFIAGHRAPLANSGVTRVGGEA